MEKAIKVLSEAKKPLVIIGKGKDTRNTRAGRNVRFYFSGRVLTVFHVFFYSKLISFLYIGAAYAHAEKPLQEFVERSKLPFLPTPMGKGVISDDHSLCVAAARSRYI